MELNTSRFGKIEIEEEKIITLPEGLIGFANNKRYIILPHRQAGSPFKWLQSVDDPSLAFIIIDPLTFKPGYQPCLDKGDLAFLELDDAGRAEMYVLVVVPSNPERISANLIAPLVVNPGNKLAKQVILSTSEYGTRHYIVQEMKEFAEARIAEKFGSK